MSEPHGYIIENPAKLAALSAQCLHQLYIRNYKTNAVLVVDLLRGVMRLSDPTSPTGAKGAAARCLNFAQAYEATGDGSDAYRANLAGFYNALRTDFRLSQEAIADLDFLLRNRKEYVETVLVDPGASMLATIHLRDAAVAALYDSQTLVRDLNLDLLLLHLQDARAEIDKAAQAIHDSQSATAADHYASTLQIADLVKAAIARRFETVDILLLNRLRYINATALLRYCGPTTAGILASSVASLQDEYPILVPQVLRHLGEDIVQSADQSLQGVKQALDSMRNTQSKVRNIF